MCVRHGNSDLEKKLLKILYINAFPSSCPKDKKELTKKFACCCLPLYNDNTSLLFSAQVQSGLYDKQYSCRHKFSITITVFAVTLTRDFQQVNLATFDFQNVDFHAVW